METTQFRPLCLKEIILEMEEVKISNISLPQDPGLSIKNEMCLLIPLEDLANKEGKPLKLLL